jgi:protein-L-isoaspartate(D-aspartate) O-methyltransferase
VSDEASLTRLRERLAARVISAARIRDDRIAAALREVPRHLFLPQLPPESAYRDDAIVTKRDADGQPISSSSQPAIMAIMLDQLALAPGLRVLEIGAGTGYNAALMRHIVGPAGTVVSVDIDADVAGQARDHLVSAGYPDVTVVTADGAEGYPGAAPYDRVIATVGVSDLAPSWLEQTEPGGRIVVPLDVRGTQLAVAFERAGDGPWTSVSLVPCGFIRMRGSRAGPERNLLLQPGLSVMLPDGLTLADGKDADADALAAYLAGPPVNLPTGVRTGSVQVVWGPPRPRGVPGGRTGPVRRVPAGAGTGPHPGVAVHLRDRRFRWPRGAGHRPGPVPGVRGGPDAWAAHAGGHRVRPAGPGAGGQASGARPGLGSGRPARRRRTAHRRLPALRRTRPGSRRVAD